MHFERIQMGVRRSVGDESQGRRRLARMVRAAGGTLLACALSGVGFGADRPEFDAKRATSVSSYSARKPALVRALVAAQLRGTRTAAASAASVSALFPFLPGPAPQLRAAANPTAALGSTRAALPAQANFAQRGLAAKLASRPAEPKSGQDSAKNEQTAEQPRRRAAFRNSMHRAAASSAVALSSSTNSFRPSTSSERFSAGSVDAYSQGMQDAADTISLIPGLRLEGVSLFGGYSSNAVPRGLVSSRGNANLGSDYDYGGQATLAFRSRGATSSLGLTYTPSHVQRANFSQWSSTNHVLSLRGSKSVGPRWTIALNANAADTGLEQFWLNAPVLRTVTNRPTTLEELFSAVEAGELSDDEFASVLTGAPVVDDPGGPGFDSSRILSASAGASVSYAYSPRISFVFGGSGSRTDLRGGELSSENRGRLYVRNTQSTNGYAQARYRLSPATTILVTNRSTLSDSTFLRTASNSTLVGIEQQLTRRISYGLGIGAGYFNRLQSTSTGFGEGAGSTWAANGDLAYTRGAHRLIAQADRSVGDPMGFGALNSWRAGARWIWAPARARWTIDAGFNYLQTQYGQGRLLGGNLESNLYSGGLVRRLNASTALRSEYYYGRYVSPFTGVFSNTAIHRVQTSLIWRPVERR